MSKNEVEIAVEMKRGGSIVCPVEGDVYNDSDGSGAKWVQVDDLTVYWPGKKGNKKRYEMKQELIHDIEKVEEDFVIEVDSNRDNW